ncbi:MAG TPA: hypothetical protein VNB64_00415 [Solirubrobacteraceae bacterium]|nr:hypothetical protein [Solirubrobacteraceae bacterium]
MVTALGGEVNEAAQLEQSTKHWLVRASKALLERLDAKIRAAVCIDATTIA